MMQEKKLLLLLHPSQPFLQNINLMLSDTYSCMTLSDLDEAYALFKIIGYKTKIVLLYNGFDMPVDQALKQFRKINNSPEFLIFSDEENLNEAVKLLKLGAFDYIVGPFKKESLLQKLNLAIKNIDYTQKLKELTERVIIEQATQTLKSEKNLQQSGDNHCSSPEILSLREQLKVYQEDNPLHNQARLLIIEDNESILMSLQKLLVSSFEVNVAQNLDQARALIKKQKFDLILLDIYLPDGIGTDFIQEIKEEQEFCAIIIMTAYKEIDLAIKALQLGADDYLNKPFLETTLMNALYKHLKFLSIKKILPKLQNWITENIIPSEDKLSLLNECSKSKDANRLKMRDFYVFFPELRNGSLDDTQSIPEHLLQEGLLPFMEALKNGNV